MVLLYAGCFYSLLFGREVERCIDDELPGETGVVTASFVYVYRAIHEVVEVG